MASVATYLNFERSSEEAFSFYQTVFGTELLGPPLRHGDVGGDGVPEEWLPDDDKNLIMNIAMPILGGHIIMATDVPKSMGMEITYGNNVQITLMPDTRAEADALHAALAAGGEVGTPMQEMFWGDYYGEVTDKFGVRWLINTDSKE